MRSNLGLRLALLSSLMLAACVDAGGPYGGPIPVPAPLPAPDRTIPASDPADLPPPPRLSPAEAARNFVGVVDRLEPVAERECARRAPGMNCDYLIVVDDRLDLPANAAQTLDRSGRPVIVFTLALIAEARNSDELAFVLGHEASHHILGHLARQSRDASLGGILAGGLGQAIGADASTIDALGNIGATVGSRRYSKDMELEADELGTYLAWAAGYDPMRGAEFFARMPDPGNRFLGSHPGNAARIAVIRRTAAALGG